MGNGDGTFRAPVRFSAGPNPTSLVVGDFNGDGIPDLATADLLSFTEPGAVSVLLGNGNGTFQAARNFPTGSTPIHLAAADLNGDGNLDLVTLNGPVGGGSLSVLLGNGNGTFRLPMSTALSFVPAQSALTVADLNGDKIPDVVVVKLGLLGDDGGIASVLLGNGDGTLRPPYSFPVGPSGASAVAAVDLNGTGVQDLVIANGPGLDNANFGSVSVLLGNGDGSFSSPKTFPTGAVPTAVVVADLRSNGILDIVTANREGSSVSVLLGQKDGSFPIAPSFPVGAGPRGSVHHRQL